MSDSFLGLNISVTALRAFQQALGVVQHNVSNANTEGYSRQTAVLAPVTPEETVYGEIGRGVLVTNIVQTRNVYLDYNVRKETQTAGAWEAKKGVYDQIEVIFNEPSNTAFSSVMSGFWSAWDNVANDPADPSLRTNLLDKAQAVVDSFKQIDKRLSTLQTVVNDDIQSNINQVNAYADSLAALNSQIRTVESNGVSANDLRDSRNLIVDKLNKIVPVSVFENGDGSVNVTINGEALVSSTASHKLMAVRRAADPSGAVDIKWAELNKEVTPKNGVFAGLIEMRDSVLPEYRDKMNTLAAGIISGVNAVHRTGMGLDATKKITGGRDFTGTLAANGSVVLNGETVSFNAGDDLATIVARFNTQEIDTGVHASVSGNRLVLAPSATGGKTVKIDSDPNSIMLNLGIVNDFFTGTSASDISISSVVKSDANLIAASKTGAPGDGQIAAQIAALQDLSTTMSGGTNSFDGYYNATMAHLGVTSDEATMASKNQTLVLDQLEEMRQSVMGVSVDEEMVKMIQYQRGYEAAAKMITIIDGMLDTLIRM